MVGADGEQLGVMDTQAALRMASQQDLDMVEVAPMARPPVVKLMDYSKFKYEQAIKAKEARRKQNLVALKEMKMRPKIDPHDYQTKKGHVERFLKQGHKVKVTIMFRGREMAHTELGRRLLERLATDLVEIAQVDSPARQDGRNMIMVLGPHKKKADAKIDEVITNPTLGRSAKKQFQSIVKTYPRNPADGQAKARTLIDFILKHFQAGKWQGADGTGELVALILQYVELAPEAQGATACIPGIDCKGQADKTSNGFSEFAGAKIPGDVVDAPFVLLFTPKPNASIKPPIFGLVYDISTYPEGVVFSNSSPTRRKRKAPGLNGSRRSKRSSQRRPHPCPRGSIFKRTRPYSRACPCGVIS